MHVLAASARALEELFQDPLLTVACVLLIVVSVGWLLITRVIVTLLKRAARRGRRVPRIDVVKPPRDIWRYPPDRPYDQAAEPPTSGTRRAALAPLAQTQDPGETPGSGTRRAAIAPLAQSQGSGDDPDPYSM